MEGKLIEGEVVDLDRTQLILVAKPLFYGFVFMAGINMLAGLNRYAGLLLGIAGLSSLAFVSAAFSQGLKGDWKSLMDLISVTTLLLTVLFGTYAAVRLSVGA